MRLLKRCLLLISRRQRGFDDDDDDDDDIDDHDYDGQECVMDIPSRFAMHLESDVVILA